MADALNPDLELGFGVRHVKIQKDEYEVARPGPSPSSALLGDAEFWKSDHQEGGVRRFKRAVARCFVAGWNEEFEFEVIANLRGGSLTVRRLGAPIPATACANLLRQALATLWGRPGYSPEGVVSVAFGATDDSSIVARTYDTNWVAGELKTISELGPIPIKIPVADLAQGIESFSKRPPK